MWGGEELRERAWHRVCFVDVDVIGASLFSAVQSVVFALCCWMVLLVAMLESCWWSLRRGGAHRRTNHVFNCLIVSGSWSFLSLTCNSSGHRWFVILKSVLNVLLASGVDYNFSLLFLSHPLLLFPVILGAVVRFPTCSAV